MSKAGEFVSLVLLARDLAHIAHWNTKSYAEHKALGDFYEEVLNLIDEFVEQYQGYYGTRMDIQRSTDEQKSDIRQVLEYQMEWIEARRYEICDKTETPLQNTIDEIVRTYQHTLYMLTLD